MEFLFLLFNKIFYQPLFNALIFFYQYLPGRDFGLAVISLTIFLRLILYPLMAKSIKSQRALSELQPKIQEIQQKFKNDKQGQAKEIMALYRKEKISPLSSFLPLLIQLPILFAIYRVFWNGFNQGEMANLYNFMPQPAQIDSSLFQILNLANPNLALALFAGVAQFFQTKMLVRKIPKTQKSNDPMARFSKMMEKQMLYFFPIFTIFILWKLPAVLALYWVVTTLFSIGQQYLILRPQKGNLPVPSGAEKYEPRKS